MTHFGEVLSSEIPNGILAPLNKVEINLISHAKLFVML